MAARAGKLGAQFRLAHQLDFALLSLSEQACASASLGDLSLPKVAQPAFVTMSLRE